MADAPRRILLVGWDSADWRCITPLMDRGAMPALEALVEEGVSGTVSTLHPTVAPLVWTSLATGKGAPKHGVLGFVERDPARGLPRPVSTHSRQAKALWNILSDHGLRSHVIGWYGSHPAERIAGVSVSPRYATSAEGDGLVHPEEFREVLRDLHVRPMDITAESLLPFVPRAVEVDQWHDDRLARVALGLAAASSIHNAATWVLEREPWDFAAVFYHSLGYLSQQFMRHHPPGLECAGDDNGIYQEVIAGAYRFHDLMLRRLVELAGPGAVILVASAHGYHCGSQRPRPGDPAFLDEAAWHRELGILALKGPGLRQDELVHGASILDIAPTVLALLGLPTAHDMDGRVLAEAFDEPPQTGSVDTFESVTAERGGSRVDPALAEQFTAFARVEPQAAPLSSSGDQLEELRFNLARAHLSAGHAREGLEILEELHREAPEDARYLCPLVQAYLASGRYEEATTLLRGMLAGREPRPWMHFFLAIVLLREKRFDEAFAALARAEDFGARTAALHVLIAGIYLAQRRWDEADRALRTAMETDPDSAEVHLGTARLRLAQRRYPEAAEAALAAIGLRYSLPAAHAALGVALARMRDYERARTALRTALWMSPRMRYARRCLALLERRA